MVVFIFILLYVPIKILIIIIFLKIKIDRRIWPIQGFPSSAKASLDSTTKNDTRCFVILQRSCSNRNATQKNTRTRSIHWNRNLISNPKLISLIRSSRSPFFSEWQENIRTHVSCSTPRSFNLYVLRKNYRVRAPSYREVSSQNLRSKWVHLKESQNGVTRYL